jgi:hypothetical protein
MVRSHVIGEDWLAFWLGILVFVLALGPLVGLDLLGWAVKAEVWTDLSQSLLAVSESYKGISAFGSLVTTYIFLLVLLTAGAWLLRAKLGRFIFAFTVVFWVSYGCWLLGHQANLAATTETEMQQFGLSWSLRLTPEGGYIIALLVGLIIGNLSPRAAKWVGEAIRPELYIKIAIVLLGAKIGVIAAQQLGLATTVMFRGLAAIIEAYLIYWAIVYFIAPVLQVLARVGRTTRLGHLDLRRLGRHGHRCCHSCAPDRAHHGLVAGRDLRRD